MSSYLSDRGAAGAESAKTSSVLMVVSFAVVVFVSDVLASSPSLSVAAAVALPPKFCENHERIIFVA